MRIIFLVSFFLVLTSVEVSNAQSIDERYLSRVKEAVVAVCGVFARSGSANEVSGQGAASVELTSIARLLAEVGVDGDAKYSAEEYFGVLREELGDEIKDNRSCRLKIWNDFVSKLEVGQDNATEIQARVSNYASSSSLFDCKETQYFQVCIDSTRLRGNFADLNVSLKNVSEETIKICQYRSFAYAISFSGIKAESPGGNRVCRDVTAGGSESFTYFFEFSDDAGESFDATILFERPATQFTFRDLR